MSSRWARTLAATAALLLAGGTLLQCRDERAARARDVALWDGSGAAARHPQVALRAERDPDPAVSRVELARVLLADATDLRPLAALPHEEALAGARRAQESLRVAADSAAATLRRRPTSWEAAMVLGAARLLLAARTPGDEPYRDAARWRAPLLHAMALAPGSPEPSRLLLAGTLASWYALSDRERVAARSLLRASFADRTTLAQLLPAWTAVAGSEAELMEVLPREPYVYELLQEDRARQHDWAGFCAARRRWVPLQLEHLQQQLTEAEARLAGGDVGGGRQGLQSVIADAPVDRRAVALVGRAVEDLPPGPLSPSIAGALDRWLAWGLPLWQLDLPTLPEGALSRMAGVADLPPEHAALAALAAGDLDRAEVWERRSDRVWSEEWAPYATAKAEALLARGDLDEAAETLRSVHRIYQTRWPYLHARERLAQARHDASAPAAQQELGATQWPPSAWLYEAGQPTLELVAAAPATALRVAVDEAPAEGAVVELSLDGTSLGCTPVAHGAVLRLPIALAPGPHLLRLRALTPGRLAPGGVALVGAAGG